jgi:hypothetical protein
MGRYCGPWGARGDGGGTSLEPAPRSVRRTLREDIAPAVAGRRPVSAYGAWERDGRRPRPGNGRGPAVKRFVEAERIDSLALSLTLKSNGCSMKSTVLH